MSGDDIARALYLGVLLLAIGGGWILATRGEGMPRLRSALTWIVLFLALIVLYGQRDVILSELVPGTARRTGDGEIVISRADGGSFLARAEVNGTPVTFLVDTGASQVVLTRADARRVGLDPDALTYTGRAATANGTVRTAPVRLDRLEFAGHVARDVPASVNAGELGISLLGMTYLDRFRRIEIRGDRMVLVGPPENSR